MFHNKEKNFCIRKFWFLLFAILFVVSIVLIIYNSWKKWDDEYRLKQQKKELAEKMSIEEIEPIEGSISYNILEDKVPVILQKYQELYVQNQDFIGWLRIEGTNIDYPVMQTMQDETYYLYRDFYKEENQNGCLIMDTNSNVGVGNVEQNYENGSVPSTNLIIHGHTMKSGEMFGNLDLYADEAYGLKHRIICFDSLYENREYELISVFYSQVFYENEDVFKYYNFFQADTQEQFDDWYSNIKEKSLYDTKVTAELGDEFITLSCCSYHIDDGRFVVIAKRIIE